MATERTVITARKGLAVLQREQIGTLPAGHVRLRTRWSGVSAGTELLVLDRSRNDAGGEGGALGYQLLGTVVEVAPDLTDAAAVGDYVACYGGPYVSHASVVDVPRKLFVKVAADQVTTDLAYCGLGAVALHGFRNAQLHLGETAVVIGLGLLGNLAAQIACAAGCRVMAMDLIEERRRRATACGVPTAGNIGELACHTHGLTAGNYADAVLVATNACSDELLGEAIRLTRRGGRIVILGIGEPRLPRDLMFEREVSVIVSRAGGPGRYDREYEFNGRDYPYDLVRWTEHRNLEEFVRLVVSGKVRVEPLITGTFSPAQAGNVYDDLTRNPQKQIAVLFDWTLDNGLSV